MSLCKYKNMFGEPNTGAHKIRIFDLAIVDIVMTVIVACIIYYVMIRIRPHLANTKNLLLVIVGLFVFGIIMHRLFCVRTTIDKLLFN